MCEAPTPDFYLSYGCSTVAAPDISDRATWPTRIEASQSGKTALTAIARVVTGVMHRYNWTTVLVVSDERPTILPIAKTVQRAATVMLNSTVTLVKVDGFNPHTDYLHIMREINRQTRGQ